MSLMIKVTRAAWLLTATVALAVGCGDGAESLAPSGTGSLNVSQAGAQDFALFRSLVEDGEVPSPDTLDEVGFFAEHAVDLPAANCGHNVCLHPMLAVAPRFNGDNWTMGFVAMNTPLDPETLPRPPLHLVVAVESSNTIANLNLAVRDGLSQLASVLRPEDRLSLITFGAQSQVVATAESPTAFNPDATLAIGGAQVDLFSGLARAKGLLDEVEGFDAKRIMLITSGKANSGIDDPEHIVALGEQIAKDGIALGIVGMGEDYDAKLPTELGSLGAGTFSYAPTFDDVPELMRLEGETTLFPLATDFRMNLTAAKGYRIGRIYGAKRAWASGAFARLELPALFIGQREGAADVGGGRRGGGGGLFVELLVEPSEAAEVDANQPALTLEAQWDESGEQVTVTQDVINSLAPGENPEIMWALFSQPDYGKPFMMLNMYLAFNSAVTLYDDGDCARAKGVIDMMAPSVEGWQAEYDDPDIADDYQLMLKLRENLHNRCQEQEPIQPQNFNGGCMYS